MTYFICIVGFTHCCIAWSRSNIRQKFIFKKIRDHGKVFYEVCVYELVDDRTLS